jgi:hypothetical protein
VATKCEKAKDKIKKISVKKNVRMMICDAIDEIRVETQEELRVVVDEIAENNKNEIYSNFEKLLQNYKNESDKKTEDLQIEFDKKTEDLQIEFDKKTEDLRIQLRIVNRDNMNILKTLRTRQLIDAGRNLFYAQYGVDYESKCPDAVYNHPANGMSPRSWTDFVNFASNKKRHGRASFWYLLKGGDYSEFSNLSNTIHHANRYEIAEYFKRAGKSQGDYGDLFEKVFDSTINEVCPN